MMIDIDTSYTDILYRLRKMLREPSIRMGDYVSICIRRKSHLKSRSRQYGRK